MEGGSCRPYDWLGQEEASVPHGTEAGQADAGQALPLKVAGGDEGVGPPDPAQVDHCTVVSHLHRLSDAGLAAFQHLELVHSVFHTQGQHFVPWKPLPKTQAQQEAWGVVGHMRGPLWAICLGQVKPGEATEQEETDRDTPGRSSPKDLFCSQAFPEPHSLCLGLSGPGSQERPI